jgi:hypothetical protein
MMAAKTHLNTIAQEDIRQKQIIHKYIVLALFLWPIAIDSREYIVMHFKCLLVFVCL